MRLNLFIISITFSTGKGFTSSPFLVFPTIVAANKELIIVSELLENELSGVPNFVKELFQEILNQRIQICQRTNEVERLAETSIEEKVVGQKAVAQSALRRHKVARRQSILFVVLCDSLCNSVE